MLGPLPMISGHALAVDLIEAETDQLRHAQAGGEGQMQHRSVAYAGQSARVRCVEQSLQLVAGELADALLSLLHRNGMDPVCQVEARRRPVLEQAEQRGDGRKPGIAGSQRVAGFFLQLRCVGNIGDCTLLTNERANAVGVIALVGDTDGALVEPFKQRFGGSQIVIVAGRDQTTDRPAFRVAASVDFRREPTTAFTDTTNATLFFTPEACDVPARSSCRSSAPCRRAPTQWHPSNGPKCRPCASDCSGCRRWCKAPQRSGRSRQEAPAHSTR
jgi:hypothetical protein